jgi:CheY-like chemotaxis protein
MAHILVIDDDPSVCDVVEQLLGTLGCTVTSATSGRAALAAAANQTFAAALVDLCMPAMPGLEILRNLKTLTPSTKLIVMSGLMSDCGTQAPDFIGMAADLRGVARLPKPFGRQELLKLLGDCLDPVEAGRSAVA